MAEVILCKICGRRRARRACPAVHGDICAICCGENREVTLTCPFECEYLREAHHHERPAVAENLKSPNRDIMASENFLASHEDLLLVCIDALFTASLKTNGAVDTDVQSALEALIKTYRTLESGLIYETTADNAIAASVQRAFSDTLANYEKELREREARSMRTGDVLKILAFLHWACVNNQNGRPRGRMYIDMLRRMLPPGMKREESAPSIISLT